MKSSTKPSARSLVMASTRLSIGGGAESGAPVAVESAPPQRRGTSSGSMAIIWHPWGQSCVPCRHSRSVSSNSGIEAPRCWTSMHSPTIEARTATTPSRPRSVSMAWLKQ